MAGRQHECELYTGRRPKAAESEQNWKDCTKNPGHRQFISVPDFVNHYPPGIRDAKCRDSLRALTDLTLRLRVRYTSPERPDGGVFCESRGTDKLRVGTGLIAGVSDPVYNDPSSWFGEPDGKAVANRQWEVHVHTAHHVVYNTEEARNTVVDLFYHDVNSHGDGRMKSLKGLEVTESCPRRDVCYMRCVTRDQSLGERIESAFRTIVFETLYDLGLLQHSQDKDYKAALVVSHPHAQPKQISVGILKYKGKNELKQYTAPTCPGSSGAPVVLSEYKRWRYFYYHECITTIHNGSYNEKSTERKDRPCLLIRLFNKTKTLEKQLNYGHDLW